MSPSFLTSLSVPLSKFLFRLCLLVLVLLQLPAKAADETWINSLNGAQITSGATVAIQDQHFDYIEDNPNFWQNRFGIESSQIQARLWFDDARRDFYAQAWSVTVNYDIELWQLSGNAFTSVTYPGQLSINYDPTAPYEDIALLVYDGFLKGKITITSITPNGFNVPEDVYFDVEANTTRHYFLGGTEAPVLTDQEYIASTNELSFAWSYIEGAESYDVEYLFIDVPTAPLSGSFDYNWRNATRVNVPNNNFKFSLAYPRGVFVYRVRAVGRNPFNYAQLRKADWSLDQGTFESNTANVGMSGGSGSGFIPTPQLYQHEGHDLALNWQYSIAWAEDGKRKEAISYFDGTMRNRQSATVVNTDDNAIVASSIYDYYGRPTIGLMPAPQDNQGMRFYPRQAMVTSTEHYSWKNFDTDNKIVNTDAMSTQHSTGAANYYSPDNNGDYGTHNDYLPDAEGRPFTRTLLSNDGTGRVKVQSGPGAAFQMGSNRETKYWYGTPTSQAELDRLFGNEVGFVNHYKKQLVMDANGQVSVTYTDLQGRTIATALAGDAPANLLELDTKPSTFPSIESSLNPFNNLSEDGRSWALRNTFLVSSPGSEFSFNYLLNGTDFCHECYVCEDCVYDLYIALTDEYNQPVDLIWTGADTPDQSYLYGNSYPFILLEGITMATAPGISFQTNPLAVGNYSIDKVLSINQEELEVYLQIMEEDQTCFVIPEVNATCDPCSTWCQEQYTFVDQNGNTNYMDENGDVVAVVVPGSTLTSQQTTAINHVNQLLAACQANCAETPGYPLNECDFKLGLLKIDVSPDGQYFNNLPDAVLADGITPNPTYAANGWLYNQVINGTSQTLLSWFLNQSNVSCNACSSWDDVRDQWVNAWADVLVTQHPEYCFWETSCGGCQIEDRGLVVTTEDLDEFYRNLQDTQEDYFSGGQINSTSTWFNPLNQAQQTTLPGQHHTYQPFDQVNGVDSHDPAFECDLSVRDALREELLQFLPRVANPSAPSDYFSLWYVVEDPGQIAQSNSNQNIYNVPLSVEALNMFNQLHGDGNGNPGLIGTGPNQISRWDFYRSVYIFFREKAIYNQSRANCGPRLESPNGTTTDANGFFINYPQNLIFENWGGIDLAFVDNLSQDNCDDNCEAFVNAWLDNNESCYTTSQRIAIANDMIAVCKRGCAATGEGSSNGDGNPIAGAGGATSFQEVLDHYNVNAYGCEAPVYPTPPYDQTACQCEGISDFLENFYLDNGIALGTDPNTLSTADLNELGLELDELLAAGEIFPDLTSDFLLWYNNCQSGTPNANLISALACGSEQGPATVPTPSCDDQLSALLQFQAEQLYEEQLAALRQEWEREYIAKCMNGLKAREDFSLNYTLEEYHYTLFYYDQAGNLIKTVPPQAVHDHLQDPNGVQLFEAGNASAFSVADAAVARNSNYTSKPFLHPEYELITNYRYNSLQNLVQQQTPDGGQSKLWYDGLNRVVASQNAKQVAAGNGQYSYVVYDDLGRSIEGGEITGAALPASGHYLSLSAYQNWLATATGNRTQVTRTYYDASIHQGIAAQFNSGQQNLRNRVSTSAYFEEYTPGITAATDYAYASHYSYDIHGNVIELVQQNNELKDLGQEYKKLEYDFDLVSGNVNQVSYQAGQYDEFYHRYCYDADNRITRVLTSRDGKIYEQDKKYLYYAHGPLARVETGSEQVQGCDYAYTLQGWQKGINASTGRADLDPGQDGNGATTLHQQFGQDAMGFSLHYYQGDYTRIASSAPNHLMASNNVTMNAQSADLFNGNISKMVTALTNTNNTPERVIANAYQYDQKNRLRYFRAYQDLNSFADNLRSSNGMAAGNFSNRYAGEYHYDANGNITELKRTGDQGTLNDMDRFTYNYNVDQNGKLLNNQLDWVDDPATATAYANDMDGQAAGNYTYDPIGQLESDRKEEIDNIEWYVFNKPKKVTRTGNQINGSYPADLEFRYGPNGNRCVKIAKPWSNNTGHDNEANWTYTYYVRDAAGNIMATYERTFDPVAGNTYKDQLALTEHDVYGASRAGLHLPTELKHEVEFSATSFNGDKEFSGTSYTALPDYSEDHQLAGTSNRFEYLRDLGAKQYELTNHLGNVLETVSDRKVAVDNNADDDIDNYFAQVISYSDYYPFGMQMPERTGGTLSRYGFNGMERDDELKGSGNSYDFGARIYDSRLGKFNSVDPRERDFPFMSPYCFAANMPISAIDENGEGPDIVIFSVKVTEEIKKLLANGLQVKAMTKANYYLRHGFVDDNNNPSNWQQREMVKQNVDIPLKVLLNQSAAYSHDRGEHKDGYTYLYGYQLVDGVYQNVYLGRVPDEWWHSTQNKNRVRVNAHEAGFWDEWSDEKNKDYEEWLARNVSGNTVEVDDPVNEMTEYDRRMLYESGEEGPFDHLVHNPKNDFEYSDEDDVSWDELKEGDYYYTEGEWRDYHWQQLEVKTSTDPWGYKVVELPEGQDYEDFLRLDRETRPKPTNTNGN